MPRDLRHEYEVLLFLMPLSSGGVVEMGIPLLEIGIRSFSRKRLSL